MKAAFHDMAQAASSVAHNVTGISEVTMAANKNVSSKAKDVETQVSIYEHLSQAMEQCIVEDTTHKAHSKLITGSI